MNIFGITLDDLQDPRILKVKLYGQLPSVQGQIGELRAKLRQDEIITILFEKNGSLGFPTACLLFRTNGQGRRKESLIHSALKRLDDKTFGICTDCDSLIPNNRLLVNPLARRCTGCQDKFERIFTPSGKTPILDHNHL